MQTYLTFLEELYHRDKKIKSYMKKEEKESLKWGFSTQKGTLFV